MIAWLALVLALVACGGSEPPGRPPAAVVITTDYPGASPELVERHVVEVLEAAVNSLPGVRSIESRIEGALATVTVGLEREATLDMFTVQAREAIAQTMRTLPPDVAPPVITKQRREPPALVLALRGTLAPTELAQVVDHTLVPQLQRIPGVAALDRRGIPSLQIIVRADRAKLAATGTTVVDLVRAIETAGRELPGGRLEAQGQAALVRIEARIDDLAELGALVVKQLAGHPVRVADLATIERTLAGEPGPLTIAVHAQLRAEPADVRARVRAALPALALPHGLTVDEQPAPPVSASPSLAVAVYGPELRELDRLAGAATSVLRRAGVTHVVRDPPPARPSTTITPDHERMVHLAVDTSDVATTIAALTSSTSVGSLEHDGHRLPILVRVGADSQPLLLDGIMVPGRDQPVALAQLATTTADASPIITRRNRQRVVTLTAPGAIRDAVRAQLRELEVPPGYRLELRQQP